MPSQPSPTVEIAGRPIGPEHEPFVIAAINSCHGGDYALAQKQIEMAQRAGADAVKFQNFDADSLVPQIDESELDNQPWMKTDWEHSPKPVSLHYFYGQILQSPYSLTRKLLDLSAQLGMVAFSTPLSLEDARDLISRGDQPAFKLTAHESEFGPLIEALARAQKPLLLNTAVSQKPGILQALKITDELGAPAILLTGPKLYEMPEKRANVARHFGMNRFQALRLAFRTRVVGISDHFFPTHIDGKDYLGHEFAVTAVMHGASVISKAFCGIPCDNLESQFASLDGEMADLKHLTTAAWKLRQGQDVPSQDREEIARCMELSQVDGAKNLFGPNQAEVASNETGLQRVLTARRAIEAGTSLKLGDLHFTRLVQAKVPFREQLIPSMHTGQVIGTKVTKSIPQGYPLRMDQLSRVVDTSAGYSLLGV